MKSLALHLITLLLLGALHIIVHNRGGSGLALLVAAAATATPVRTSEATTTTLQPPSLHAPRHYRQRTPPPATTVMSTSAPLATTVRQQQQQAAGEQQQQQRQSATRRLLAHANTNSINPAVESATMFESARLVRNANSNIAGNGSNSNNNSNATSVRQNRSLQSAAASALQHNSNNNHNYDAAHAKYAKHTERRQQYRGGSNNSQSSTSTASPVSGTATRTAHASLSPFVAATSSSAASNHRQSKHSSLPLLVGGAEHESQARRNATNSSKLPQTPKTPRMIQRLVAGHIQNAEGRSTYQVSAVSANSTVSNSSTTLKPTPMYYRRKEAVLSSSYRHVKSGATTPTHSPMATTTKRLEGLGINAEDDDDDDEALLDDAGDFDNWDNGILRLSAGSGKESATKSKKNKDDSKKTLSDQVRDGKYGLIEKELFRRQPKRPGVLSYLPNKEVPYDNERNFGGLNEEDIWLAEDHLLVIKGGSLNEDEPNEPWAPIDDYDAPGRQIKIPPNPKVPPPFPVQLEENGPIQFIGNNKFTVVYPVANESIPVYTAGPEANYAPSASEGDNEKNLIARPGSPQNTAEGEPGYLYPAPYPPWLYHNQTFVNPFLSNARPITFPGLGPFPFGRNGSLESSNGTDYFDEDDPSLYYPPAYSFVYKSNYTNPVAPGPLVPGIVLPPPANQFSRLEKGDKKGATSAAPPTRQRVYATTSSTSTTTTTTSTTTQAPYRQVITKISEYTPKTIIITPEPPVILQPTTSTTIIPPTPPPTPEPTFEPPIIEPVPVPVAVPIPVYPSNKYPTSRPIVSFVPTTPEPTNEPLSKSNPIYYEYFEAKRQPATSNVIDGFLSTTAKPAPASKPIKLYATSKRPFKTQSHRNFLQPVSPNRHYEQENIVYITPKPEVRYKRPPPQAPIFRQRPLDNFEREVNAIRETLRYYQNQQLRDNNIPRTPKAKPIYEYSFDATKNLEPVQPTVTAANFQPPADFDEEPFKPMVTYSPPVGDENAFHAIAIDKADESEAPLQPRQQPEQPKYQTTTTLVPVQSDVPQYLQQPQPNTGRPKKLRLGAKYLQPAPEYREQSPQYQTTPRPLIATQPPWLSQPQRSERLQLPQPRHRGFGGYYYGAPPPLRQNNRFYDEPFQQAPVRKIVNYRPQPQPQQEQQQPIWNLENDTYVNYAPNRPPLNPDAEFINPYQTIPVNPYAHQGQRYPPPQPPPPPISHQSQYYAPPQRFPPQPQPTRQYQQQQIPLHRDILVNYRQPLPPINPDSEYISHPQVVRNQASQIYRSNAYRLPPTPAPDAQDEQADLYYITPKYRRSNNNYNSNNNNNKNKASTHDDNNSNNSNGNGNGGGGSGSGSTNLHNANNGK